MNSILLGFFLFVVVGSGGSACMRQSLACAGAMLVVCMRGALFPWHICTHALHARPQLVTRHARPASTPFSPTRYLVSLTHDVPHITPRCMPFAARSSAADHSDSHQRTRHLLSCPTSNM